MGELSGASLPHGAPSKRVLERWDSLQMRYFSRQSPSEDAPLRCLVLPPESSALSLRRDIAAAHQDSRLRKAADRLVSCRKLLEAVRKGSSEEAGVKNIISATRENIDMIMKEKGPEVYEHYQKTAELAELLPRYSRGLVSDAQLAKKSTQIIDSAAPVVRQVLKAEWFAALQHARATTAAR